MAKFRVAILQADFYHSHNDNSLFVRRTPHGCTLLLLYVDDMISGNDVSRISTLKTYLMHHFKMKDPGPLTYFHVHEITHSKAGIPICQKKYAEDLLSMAQLTDSKVYDTPLECNAKL